VVEVDMARKRAILAEYDDDLFGIPVVIRNAVVRELTENGESYVTIPYEDGLHAAIAMARCLIPVKLSPTEIRMLRKSLGMKSKDFAEALSMSPARLSRLEKDTQGLGSFTELQIRQFVAARLSREAPAIDYDPAEIACMRLVEGEMAPLVFERVRLKMSESRTKSDEWDLAA
jgi:DNA-binding transcriptional regulator YiaG